jgi:hypothetical protein
MKYEDGGIDITTFHHSHHPVSLNADDQASGVKLLRVERLSVLQTALKAMSSWISAAEAGHLRYSERIVKRVTTCLRYSGSSDGSLYHIPVKLHFDV